MNEKMISLHHITSTDRDFAVCEGLYLDAFPRAERRETAEWRQLADERTDGFRLCAIVREEQCVGLLSYWDFSEFIYVEHFATLPEVRQQGIGGKSIETLLRETAPRPVVLEVELPETAEARRRIAFYERNGLKVVAQDYLQPPYRQGDDWFPLLLMATDEAFADKHFERIRQTIYAKVYRQP